MLNQTSYLRSHSVGRLLNVESILNILKLLMFFVVKAYFKNKPIINTIPSKIIEIFNNWIVCLNKFT